MGKPTGFMEYDRCEAASVEPKERIKNFNEFHVFLSKENQQKQAARCMDCGVPFCQSGMTIAGMTSGCPLHNLVPEWNDLVYTGNWEQAYAVSITPCSLSLTDTGLPQCPHVHAFSHSAGQTLDVNSGKLLVLCRRLYACSCMVFQI